ncbi:thyroglobulin [Pleurodeles waltl]|uniref:thyroglobulin n=1 Tax=Pleurodeles waltl TaxID=8319 RepID=UPI003709B4FD
MGHCHVTAFLCLITVTAGKISEYQLDSQPLRPCELEQEKALVKGSDYVPQCSEDGSYRNTQCSSDGGSCWCVDTHGVEIPGSKKSGSAVVCLSFCQLQKQQILVSGYINRTTTTYVPQCSGSGEFNRVQCDLEMKQCWCVDSEGMEIYGTRQPGKIAQCPGSCEVRDRRVLHGVGEKTPPQCSAEGEFLPVQCKFVNTSDMMVFDLVHNFNRFPGIFQSFSSFRKMFPDVSGYCYCVDSLGRELEGTGLELLLDEVYDTIAAGLDPANSFTDTVMYRILQRRFLGVQLIISGRFRCPSKCELERFTAASSGDVLVPSCDDRGQYRPLQCQRGGQCWCVDARGREIYGTRSAGEPPSCSEGQGCIFKRRQALSRLFYGPVGYFRQHSLFKEQSKVSGSTETSPKHCSSYLQELFATSGLLSYVGQRQEVNQSKIVPVLSEAIQGLFPSRKLGTTALQLTSSAKRFQQNLFGGKFLKNLSGFNFTGSIGQRGKLNFSQFFEQVGLQGMYSGGNFVELAKLFSPEDNSYLTKESLGFSKDTFNLDQTISDNFGHRVNLQENQNMLAALSSLLEQKEFLTLMQHVTSVPESIAVDLTDVIKAVLELQECDEASSEIFVPTCTNDERYDEVQCLAGECWCVDASGNEILGSKIFGKHPKCPTECEKTRDRLNTIKKSQPANSELFVPSCTSDGAFLPVQCAGKKCFCVDLEGRSLPGTESAAGEPYQCPSACQLTAGQSFLQMVQVLLSSPATLPQFSSVYIPQCKADGGWRAVQCNGPTEQAFDWYQAWVSQNNAGKDVPLMDIINEIMEYKKTSAQDFAVFVGRLYGAGHQNVFPIFSKYATFDSIPSGVLEGNFTSESDNILLNPYIFWRLLNGSSSRYPGSYRDFNLPYGHFELRNCWCVDEDGMEIQGTRAEINKIPKCPGPCERVRQRAMLFVEEAEQLIAASNSSHFAFGHSFLLASGVRLTDKELFRSADTFRSGVSFSERLLTTDDYSLRLAAQSTLHFYWKRYSASRPSSFGETTLFGFQPYIPKCDGLGNWEPVQCYKSTGHCWCVDEKGQYITGSLQSRAPRLPQCKTPCQLSRANALISGWKHSESKLSDTPVAPFTPACLETGEYALQQNSGAGTWCVNPITGKIIQQLDSHSNTSVACPGFCTSSQTGARVQEVGLGYIPVCREDNRFTPVQCEQGQESCFCVFKDGAEAPGTRVSITGGRKPACDRPQCATPFGTLDQDHGALFCEVLSVGGQQIHQCQLLCHEGYENALADVTYQCDLETHQWVSQPPHPKACQKLQLHQTVKVQTSFQLLLPATKACNSGYSGLLQAFQTFVLDDLKARGLCQIKVSSLGSTKAIPLCDDSSVSVECLGAERLIVNITWRSPLEAIPTAALPDLHDIENAVAGDGLVGRFVAMIRSGDYLLNVDSKQFPADMSIDFPQDADFSLSPLIQLGCMKGFRRIYDMQRSPSGCVPCPPGSYLQDEVCIPCPRGFYQELAGSESCTMCPSDKSTIAMGAYKESYCLTSCQMNNMSLKCDEDGQYKPSQNNDATKVYFCLSVTGERLAWTETEGPLSDAQCLVMRKFEAVPESKMIVSEEVDRIFQSDTSVGGNINFVTCFSDCAQEESCEYFTVSVKGAEVLCEQYRSAQTNVNCSTSEKGQNILGNSASMAFEFVSCLLKVKRSDADKITAFQKKGQEFTTSGLKTFEKTDFRNARSGVYNTLAFSAAATTLTDAHLFCRQSCELDSCCDGFVLSQIILNGGSILCGLMNSPDVLLCNENDWTKTSKLGGDGVCKGVKSNKEQKQFSFSLGGQEFTGTYSLLAKSIKSVEYSTTLSAETKEEIQRSFASFQSVYLWRDSNVTSRPPPSQCGILAVQAQNDTSLPDTATQLFELVETRVILVEQNRALPQQQYRLSKQTYSAKQAGLWCLTRCADESAFCQIADLRDTSNLFFTCTLYSQAHVCDNFTDAIPENCNVVLPQKPQLLYKKKVVLEETAKNFYSRLPFRKLTGISAINKIPITGKSVSNGFFDCERHCDADVCCKGFGFLPLSGSSGDGVLCLMLSSLGVQTCSEEVEGSWRATKCNLSDSGKLSAPFGWFQKPEIQQSKDSSMCPPVPPHYVPERVPLDAWKRLDSSSTLIDASLLNFDIAHISLDHPSEFVAARNYCLSVCSQNYSCVVTTLDVQPSAVRCVFYPETQTCTHSLEGRHCQLLLKEPAAYIYRRQDLSESSSESIAASAFIASHGTIFGRSQSVQIGPGWKNIHQFLGIPYAAAPLAEKRFLSPEPYNWTGSWNATAPRATCWQPGDGKAQYSSVSEDCLYLNIYAPAAVRNAPVMVFFHNSPSDYSSKVQAMVDGSYLAAVGDIIVVTASYRVGIFGFLTTDSVLPSGNWGLLDQAAALEWVQRSIAGFGGDPSKVTLAAERGGADIASLHALRADTNLFRRAALMGGSAFSPVSVISKKSARELASLVASDVGCPLTNNGEAVSCLRGVPADALNAAQTKLLAKNGPFQSWGPVVDGVYIREQPSSTLLRSATRKIDLLIGSAAKDGLIRRAKAIKKFEESQGRGESKTAFYQALQNSLGGESLNPLVRDAAVWYYSLEHSSDDYSVFSRALENSTRDHFVICPAINMVRHWAETNRGNTFMYYVPESALQSSFGLELPEDVVFIFGLPLRPQYQSQFTEEEKRLSLKIMQYAANFVKSGNPNYSFDFSRHATRNLPPWPMYLSHSDGDNYKEFTASLENHKGLKKADCSFWNKYIPALKASTSVNISLEQSTEPSLEDTINGSSIHAQVTQSPTKKGADAYN